MILRATGGLWFRYFRVLIVKAFSCVHFLVAGCLRAGQTLDYDEAVEKSLKNAPDITMAELDIRISGRSEKEQYLFYYPTISARWTSDGM
jgi:hypothetical protein